MPGGLRPRRYAVPGTVLALFPAVLIRSVSVAIALVAVSAIITGLLLLPVGWLLERRQWWAIVVPLSMSIPLVGVAPAAVYPVAFVACLVAPIVVGAADRRHAAPLDGAGTAPGTATGARPITLDSTR